MRGEFRATPRINTDGAITLDVTVKDLPTPAPRTLRASELTVYELTGPQASSGKRLFFFLRPTTDGKSGGGSPIVIRLRAVFEMGQSATVTL